MPGTGTTGNKPEETKPLTFKEEFTLELQRRQDEMKEDIYGSRAFSDGVREEIKRLEEWLKVQTAE
jgi:hypothetical protein